MSEHGGNLDMWRGEFPDARALWLDLSTGVCPWPYPIDHAAATKAAVELPTQAQFQRCAEAMSDAYGCEPECILPIAGTEQVIKMLPGLLSLPLQLSLPTYPDYELAWRQASFDIQYLADAGVLSDPGMTSACRLICNPNNPDGRHWSRKQLTTLHDNCLHASHWLVIDEAYGDLQPEHSMAFAVGRGNLIVLKSFGKFFGLPGLRLGAILVAPEMVRQVRARLGHWHVSTPALEIGARAYADRAWQQDNRRRLVQASSRLRKVLGLLFEQEVRGTELFLTLRNIDARGLWRHLMSQGIYTRYFDEFPDMLRLGLPAGLLEEERLIDALRLYLHGDASN